MKTEDMARENHKFKENVENISLLEFSLTRTSTISTRDVVIIIGR